MALDATHDESERGPEIENQIRPGVVVLLAAGQPSEFAVALEAPLEFGRGFPDGLFADDSRVSRRHVRISKRRNTWHVEDLESRNGTFVAGERIDKQTTADGASVLVRIGRSLLWAVDDVTPFLSIIGKRESNDQTILGGRLQSAWNEIALAGRAGDTLFVRGESGSGKELAAQAFHRARHPDANRAPFIAVNCAAIPEGLAERLLFGTRKGAYSGAAADAEGYIEAAHTGTLFLDEVAELDAQVQAKLLRVLETHEVLALGASKPRAVTIDVCVATHKNLRDEVRSGRFREDLYFRVGRPEIKLPALRERLDEIPRHVARQLALVDERLSASTAFIEACSLRPWPGNVRELLGEIRRAAHRALTESALVVDVKHLASEAGQPLAPESRKTSLVRELKLTDEQITKTLAEQNGNVRGTARALGMHRNQLRRWLEKRAAKGGPPVAPTPGEGTTQD